MRKIMVSALVVLALLAVASPAAQAQDVQVRPKEVHHVVVEDGQLIDVFRREQLLSPTLPIDSLEFVDVTMNGFSSGDLMIIYPGERVVPLFEISSRLRSIMNEWSFPANLTYSAPSVDPTLIQEDVRLLRSPFAGILATLLKGIDYYYTGSYIEGFFRVARGQDVATITLWNYEDRAMRYREGSPMNVADTLRAYDLLKLYINETVSDTVFVPVETAGGE